MNKHKLHWIFNRFQAEEDGSGTAAGSGAAPAAPADANDAGAVDWGDMSDGVQPGADEGGGSDEVELDPNAPEGTQGHEDDDPTTQTTTTDEPQTQATETPVTEAEEVKTPEQIAAEQKELTEKFAKWRQGQLEALEKTYGFDEDTAARLQTEPELVLPQLAARMHMDIMQSVVETVQRMMPQMMQPVLKQTDVEAKANDLFYGINSDLDRVKHHKHVLAAAQTYRQMNPKATPEEAAKGIGEIVRVSMGLKTKPAVQQNKGKTLPHRPPAAGSRGATAPKAKMEPSVWSDLADDE
ncbi:MAG: hypothetical protein ACKOX6_00865 [Bdellovibrio sp.]